MPQRMCEKNDEIGKVHKSAPDETSERSDKIKMHIRAFIVFLQQIFFTTA